MKIITLLFCEEALFGIFAPISFLTTGNFQEAMRRLKKNECDIVYIALDQFINKRKKGWAEKYLKKRIKKEFQDNVFISATARPYAHMFQEYVKDIRGDVCVDVLAKPKEKKRIGHAIEIPAC